MSWAGSSMERFLARSWVPLVLFLCATALAQAAGFQLVIPWSHFQILDRPALVDDPWGALWLLHSQPPLLNALLALCLHVAEGLGTSPELVLKAVFLAVGLASVVLFHDTLLRATGSTRWAAFAAAALVAEPAYHFYGNHGWYPFLIRAELVALAWGVLRLSQEGSRRWLWFVLGMLVVLPSTRALFHPAWSLVTGGVVCAVWARRFPEQRGGRRGLVWPAVIFLLALSLWPLKNAIVFGRFSYSTLTGVNLVRITDVDQSDWLAYQSRGEVLPKVESVAQRFAERHGATRASVVTSSTKADGSRNWNHLMLLEVGPDLTERSLRWRWENSSRWRLYTTVQYFMWARPAHVLSYTGEPRGPESPAYRSYAGAWEALLFTDVRGVVEALAPELELHKYAKLRATGKPLPYTLFALLWFPLGLVLISVRLAQRSFRERPEALLVALCLWAVLWTMVVPCLTDGIEANRMHFSTSPLWLTALILCSRLGARRATPRAEP